MNSKIKIIVSIVSDCSVCLFGGWMLIIQNGGDVNFQLDNPQVNTTVSKQ